MRRAFKWYCSSGEREIRCLIVARLGDAVFGERVLKRERQLGAIEFVLERALHRRATDAALQLRLAAVGVRLVGRVADSAPEALVRRECRGASHRDRHRGRRTLAAAGRAARGHRLLARRRPAGLRAFEDSGRRLLHLLWRQLGRLEDLRVHHCRVDVLREATLLQNLQHEMTHTSTVQCTVQAIVLVLICRWRVYYSERPFFCNTYSTDCRLPVVYTACLLLRAVTVTAFKIDMFTNARH